MLNEFASLRAGSLVWTGSLDRELVRRMGRGTLFLALPTLFLTSPVVGTSEPARRLRVCWNSKSIWINFGIYLSAKITCKDRIYFRIYLSAISDLNRKINAEVHPVFTSRNIKDELKAKEPKPPIVNQQNVVYSYFKKGYSCDP